MGMRKLFLYGLMLGVFLLLSFHETGFAKKQSSNQLQRRIDETPAGETLEIPPGTYESPISITKPIKLTGRDVILTHQGAGPALSIQTDHVYLEGIDFYAPNLPKNDPVILLQGDHHTITQITMETSGSGIFLRESQDNQIDQVTIQGINPNPNGPVKLSERGNGIDLRESHRNLISNNELSNLHDGIYMESSDDNRVVNNQVNHSRYGFHSMYTKRPIIENNTGDQNVTGAMIMEADDAAIRDNQFRKQSENVHSQGLLLYEVNHSRIERNVIDGNRVGIYLEKSSTNLLANNQVVRNFIGLQMKDARNNQIVQNDFVANVTQVEAMDSLNNQILHNYWDDFQGISLMGTDKSDLPYQTSPFFLKLATRQPAYQLFFQSPGMVFLEKLLQTDTSQGMTDPEPLMNPVTMGMKDNLGDETMLNGAWASILLMATSCAFYLFLGRKTR